MAAIFIDIKEAFDHILKGQLFTQIVELKIDKDFMI